MKFVVVILLVIVAALARLNLPPNEVSSERLAQNRSGDIVSELANTFLYSEAVADWIYRDLIFVKFACSERVRVELIGLPFQDWKINKKNVKSCDIEEMARQ